MLQRLANVARTFAVNPRYMAFLGGLAISTAGDHIYLFAMPMIALKLTNSPMVMSFIFATGFLPNLLFGPFIGALTDRWDRRQVMLVSDMGRALLVALIPLLEVLGTLQVWHLYAVSFLLATLTTAFETASTAAVPLMVSPRELPRANALSQGIRQIGMSLGPLLAGGVISLMGPYQSLILDAFSFGGTFIAILVSPSLRPEVLSAPPSILQSVRQGLRFVWKHSVIRILAMQAMIGNIANSMVNGVLLFYLTKTLGVSELGVGYTYAVIGVMGVLGSLVTVPLTARFPRGQLYPVIVSSGVLGMLLMALVPVPFAAALGFGLVTAKNVAWMVLTTGVRQELVPNEMLGRVTAFTRVLAMAAIPVGAALAGVLTEWFGARLVFALCVLIKVGDTLMASLPSIRSIDREPISGHIHEVI